MAKNKLIKPAVVTDLTVQGTVVNQRLITAYTKSFAKHETILSVWANAATLQMAKHGNRDWMDSLFNLPVMRIKSGALSKLGTELATYIKAHFPRFVWDKEHNKVAMISLQKDSILATHFVAFGATEETANPEGMESHKVVIQLRDKFYSAHGDFALTFTEFKNFEKPEREHVETAPKMTAVAFSKNALKALECFKENRFVGTVEEILDAMEKAKALFLVMDAQLRKEEAKRAESGQAASAEDVIDQGAASKLLETGRKGKSARVGGKVEPEAAAA